MRFKETCLVDGTQLIAPVFALYDQRRSLSINRAAFRTQPAIEVGKQHNASQLKMFSPSATNPQLEVDAAEALPTRWLLSD